jgi:hypothetical protein
MSILNSYLEKIASEAGGGTPPNTETLRDKMGNAYKSAKDYLNQKKGEAGQKISEGYGFAKDKLTQNKGKVGMGLAAAGALYGAKKLYDRSKMNKEASLEVAYELGYNDALETLGSSSSASGYEESTLNKIAMWKNAGY